MIEHLLDRLGYERVDVLGVSFGGMLAQQLAHQAPGRVRRLVLAATGAGSPGIGGVPGKPGALIALATPRRYRDAGYFVSEADRLYGGRASAIPDRYGPALRPPPSRRESSTSTSPAAAAAAAWPDSRNREIEATSRASAARSTRSARPKLWIALATRLPVRRCRPLCASCR